MDINKINILSHLKNNNFYSSHTFKEYNSLFNFYLENTSFIKHGNLKKWENILNKLPGIETNYLNILNASIAIGKKNEISKDKLENLEAELIKLSPWRKGPFDIFGLEIDSEWRSDKKWERIESYLPTAKNMRICDIGCSNGYYSYKLLTLKPELIVGMEKTALYVIQFLATKFYAKQIQELVVLPCSSEDFDSKLLDFDLILSMGILYHAKNPNHHINSINNLVKKNGYVILETIISNLPDNINIKKDETYAGMKNIGTIFTKNNLVDLLSNNGFKNIEIVNDSFTNSSEQRETKWMQGKSFKDFTLQNGNTLEGYPPVCRSILVAQKK